MVHSYILLRDLSENYPRGILFVRKGFGFYARHTHQGNIKYRPKFGFSDGDVAPLSEVECDLLYGIDSDADRYEVYNTPGKLKWGRNLKVGDTVLARLPGLSQHGSSDGEQQHQYTTAIIRWCSLLYHAIEYAYTFGVEIVVSSYVYIPSCIEIV